MNALENQIVPQASQIMKDVGALLNVEWKGRVIAENRTLAQRELGIDIAGQPKRVSFGEHCWQGHNNQRWTIDWPSEIRRAIESLLMTQGVCFLDDVPQHGEMTVFCDDGLLRIDYRLKRNDLVFGWGDGRGQYEIISWHRLSFL